MYCLKNIFITLCSLFIIHCSSMKAQKMDSSWSLDKCIKYALEKNIDVQKSGLTSLKNTYTNDYVKAERFPSVNASIGHNLGWSRALNVNNEYGSYANSNNTSYSVSSNVMLFNGNKLNNNIKQSEMNLQASQFDSETMKETISLYVLDAYLQVLYAEEQADNSKKQVESTTEQLNLADERQKSGAISKADYLQVKSQLASEKLTLIKAISLLANDRVNLMQLLELPVNNQFNIVRPVFGDNINQKRNPKADSIFNVSVAIKPQVKSAETRTRIAKLDIKLAEADSYPSLSMNAGINTGYSNLNSGLSYSDQFTNKVSPAIGLTLSIPIYQNKQVYSKVKIAGIETQNA